MFCSAKVVGPSPPARGPLHAEPMGHPKVPRQGPPLRQGLPAPPKHAWMCPLLFAQHAAARAAWIRRHEDLQAHRDCRRRQRQVHRGPDHRPKPVHRGGAGQAQLQHVHRIAVPEHRIHVGAEALLHGCSRERAQRLQELQDHRPVLHRHVHVQRKALQAQGIQPGEEADARLARRRRRKLRHVWHPAGRFSGLCHHVPRGKLQHEVPFLCACLV